MTKFIHIRRQVKTLFGHDTINVEILTKGGTTIAYKELDSGEVEFAVAQCSERDNYCRKTGRAIAEGRLNAGKKQSVVKREGSGIYATIEEALAL